MLLIHNIARSASLLKLATHIYYPRPSQLYSVLEQCGLGDEATFNKYHETTKLGSPTYTRLLGLYTIPGTVKFYTEYCT